MWSCDIAETGREIWRDWAARVSKWWSLRFHRQRDRARMLRAMQNLLVRDNHGGCVAQRLTTARIARVARMGAAGDDESHPVPAPKAISGGPKFYRYFAGVTICRIIRTQAPVAIADIRGSAFRCHVAQAQIQIRVLRIRAQKDYGGNWSDHVDVRCHRVGCKNQDIRAPFQFRHIARAFSRFERRAMQRRRGMGGIVIETALAF